MISPMAAMLLATNCPVSLALSTMAVAGPTAMCSGRRPCGVMPKSVVAATDRRSSWSTMSASPRRLSPRRTSSDSRRSGSRAMASRIASMPTAGWPSTARMRSPACRPATAAGLPGTTLPMVGDGTFNPLAKISSARMRAAEDDIHERTGEDDGRPLADRLVEERAARARADRAGGCGRWRRARSPARRTS